MSKHKRNNRGRFEQTMPVWTPDLWDSGYMDRRGYFRVYRPDFPKAWASGYAKRYAVVFWLKTGIVQSETQDIHHKNENILDDSFENLELLDHGEHARMHRSKNQTYICLFCKKEKTLPAGKSLKTRKFCSQACYQGNGGRWGKRENENIGIRM